ncbi:homoserine dehydrogenase [Labrys wisconsinensis]|uniref:Homoserine dehydrogenase n=1 Tax=Labrys wisconsinensis TaxID=425677 RepID=A0ABU0J328_9HYPH|nr:homoserine dehydrogenase [Labrys wisconsinensis]MDQ0468670.1 homoserine dehydrogenase [Labrys wisconsinensis]
MQAPLKIGVAGLGTVGASVVRLIDRRANALSAACGRAITVQAVSARSRGRDRGLPLERLRWFDDPVALARDPGIDVFVELIGGEEGPAREAVTAALDAGKPVVTANKALLARHGVDLARRAEKAGVALNFEAAVAGGVPIVKTLREGLLGNTIERVYGILNGTCNYILSRMEAEGLSFEACLKDAQRLGYAEADPTFDVGGFDTAHKLAILTSLAFGTEIDAEAIHVEGITQITPADLAAADELGYRIKLLGVATRTEAGVEQRVHPTMVPKSAPIAQVNGVTNAVAIDADAVQELTLVGPGAGGEATASAVVGDITDIARGFRPAPFGVPAAELAKPARAPMQAHKGGYYVRLSVVDRPGAAAAIATRMAERAISLESIVQRRKGRVHGGDDPAKVAGSVPVILITYATTEAAIRAALEAMMSDGYIAETPQTIRIERE